MDREEIRIKRKIRKLVHGMLHNMELEDMLQCADTIIFSLRHLPDCQKEGLLDSCIEAMHGVKK